MRRPFGPGFAAGIVLAQELEGLAAELGAVLTVPLAEGSLVLWNDPVEANICNLVYLSP